jgi:putative methyltransferase (TIGR04325 family)
MAENILKDLLPPLFIKFIKGFFCGWYGNFSDWDAACRKCTGYDSGEILEKVKQSALMVKKGLVSYERDSVTFMKHEYNFPVLAAVMWVASQNHGKVNLIDFGGSLGSTYFQNRLFLDSLDSLKWCIVEQPDFVRAGKELFQDEKLRFLYTIDDCLKCTEIDMVLLSSVLPYIEKPYDLLGSLLNSRIRYLLIDKMPLVSGPDRITIQRVNPKIYKASYPCWFFSRNKFLDFMKQHYDLISEYDNTDRSNIKSEFKGFIFRLKE